MSISPEVLEHSGRDGKPGSAVRLTVVGRSAPYSGRKSSHTSSVLNKTADQVVTADQHAGSADESWSIMIPVAPLQCRFVSQRLAVGIRSLAGVVLGIGVGIYLATEVTTTPPLHTKVAFVSAVCCLLGLALIPLALRDLFGSLVVDSFGIRLTPSVFGFAIPWDELDRWTVDGPSFRFHSRKSGVTHIVGIDHLSAGNRQALIDTLKSCAPRQEQKRGFHSRFPTEVSV